MRLNNRPYTIIGVAERGFSGTTVVGADFWVPMAMEQHVHSGQRSMLTQHNAVWMTALGRLKPGATVASGTRRTAVDHARLPD